MPIFGKILQEDGFKPCTKLHTGKTKEPSYLRPLLFRRAPIREKLKICAQEMDSGRLLFRSPCHKSRLQLRQYERPTY